jgi:thioredoxin 1
MMTQEFEGNKFAGSSTAKLKSLLISVVVVLVVGVGAVKWIAYSSKPKTGLLIGPVNEFTTVNFDREVLLASEKQPVLVEFYTKACSNCKIMEPVLGQVAAETYDKVIVGKVIHRLKDFPEFKIRTIPTILIFYDGEVKGRFTGVTAKKKLVRALEQFL